MGFGTQTKQLPLVSSFDPDSGQGTKGVYNAYFVPTVPGDYTFHFSGSIYTTKVNITVKSSPTTFDSAHDPAAIEFPQQAPSNLQLAQRLNAESARLSAGIQAADSKAASASAALRRRDRRARRRRGGVVRRRSGAGPQQVAIPGAAAGSQHPASVE